MPRLSLLFHSWFSSFGEQIQILLPAPSKEQLMQLQNEKKLGGFNQPNLSISIYQTNLVGKVTEVLRWFSLAAAILKIRSKKWTC